MPRSCVKFRAGRRVDDRAFPMLGSERVRILPIALFALAAALPGAEISVTGGRAVLRSGTLERHIEIGPAGVRTTSIKMGGREMLAAPAREFSVAIAREQSNRKPPALRPEESWEKLDFTVTLRSTWRSEGFDASRYNDPRPNAPKWVETTALEASTWGQPEAVVSKPKPGVTHLTVHTKLGKPPSLEGVRIELHYEVYEGHPAIRKWAVVRNGGSNWLKVDRMVIDDLQLAALTRKPLAAAMFGVQPSVVAFEIPGSGAGLIAASEIPSALRTISEQGAMGYSPALFEWIVGPGEEFTSEPVFYYGYAGEVRTTASSVSMPLDRVLEGPYVRFLEQHIGIAAKDAPMHGPQWLTWAFFFENINDSLVRQLADLAGQAGFSEFLMDMGWQKGSLGTDPDPVKFPDFAATTEYVKSKGMHVGAWVSSYRDLDSRDLAAMPNAPILPHLVRSTKYPGLAMSFASPWRDYYVKDVVEMARRYNITYVKQDFSNMLYGDMAEGHESRTRREGVLRGLRGLLEAQATLRRTAPELVNEITHEIYWGTPGVPADLAALKHTARFHIPPNEAFGTNLKYEFKGRPVTTEEHAAVLRRGCWLARQRFYSHRGMPLYALEFYAASTQSHLGSLTPAIQDRQVASWLMGAPVCYSGDLRTLSPENIAHYAKRFREVKRLEATYGIYRRFQFSGVPEPTDVDWHWWGKLDEQGRGAVVVVRGSGGAARRAVNIPWVRRDQTYRVLGLFSGKTYGVFAGAALQDAGVTLELPPYGQDLLEIAGAGRAGTL